jgi:hypothetical protein
LIAKTKIQDSCEKYQESILRPRRVNLDLPQLCRPPCVKNINILLPQVLGSFRQDLVQPACLHCSLAFEDLEARHQIPDNIKQRLRRGFTLPYRLILTYSVHLVLLIFNSETSNERERFKNNKQTNLQIK